MNRNIKNILIPTKLEAATYFTLTCSVIFVANFGYISGRLLKDSGYGAQTAAGILELYAHNILSLIERIKWTPSVAVFIFWSLAGLAVFSISQVLHHTYKDVGGTIKVSTRYLHPSNFSQWRFWFRAFMNFIWHILLVGTILTWAMLIGLVLIPRNSILLKHLFETANLKAVMEFGISLLMVYFATLIVATAVKLLFRRAAVIAGYK